MKYRIEIWVYRNLQDTYEADDIETILEWYKTHWQYCHECGGCAFDVYENGNLIDFDMVYDLGFHD